MTTEENGGQSAETASLDYGAEFRQPQFAQKYLDLYAPDSDSVDKWIWDQQRKCLVRLVHDLVGDPSRRHLLDYACGGGRVLRELAPHFRVVHGWDASEVMLAESARTVPRARLRLADLSQSDPEPNESFDVITVFRLFLNIEPDRRAAVINRITRLLAPDGVLIFDNHGNRHSLRHLAARYGPQREIANELSHRQVRDLVEGCGLQLVHASGHGWIPDFAHESRLTHRAARVLDGALMARTTSPRFAIRVLYAARRGPGA